MVLSFKEEGGLDVLSSIVKACSKAILQGSDPGQEESSKPKVAAFGLRKVLDLYLTLVNAKYFADTSNYYGIQPRVTDRSQTHQTTYQQFVVEFRAAILPQVTGLWESSILEKVPSQTVTRLLDILKMISTADHEAPSPPKDRVSFVDAGLSTTY